MITGSLPSLLHAVALVTIAVPASPVSTGDKGAEPEARKEREKCERSYHLFRPFPSQCLEPIDTDRPHQTDTPHVVDPGHVQFESAVVSMQQDLLRTSRERSLILGDNLYKVGLVNGVDLQMFYTTFAHEGATSRMGETLSFRAKFQVWGTNRTRSSLALVPLVIAPLKSTGNAEGGAQAFFGTELPAELDWEVNAGGVSQHFDGKLRVMPIFATAVTRDLVEDLALFGEVRETSSDAQLRVWDTYLDTGLLYHVTRDLQVDAGSYFGVTGAAPAVTLFTGFSVRQ